MAMECDDWGGGGGGDMNAVPDGVVQHILSMLSNVRDVAACACVCRRWRDCVPYLPALFFPRNAFDAAAVGGGAADEAIGRMVAAVSRLRELVIYCPFSMARLPAWLAMRSVSLRVLELRMDAAADKDAAGGGHLDCVALATGLEELRLWGVLMTSAPAWGRLQHLRVLEIVGAPLRDTAITETIAACPNLTDLSLLGCDCSGDVSIQLSMLQRCRLDFLGGSNCSLSLSVPRLESLEAQGFTWISLRGGHNLRRLLIAKSTGRVYKVDTGKLPDLEYLSLRGVQWSWAAVCSVLQCASEVKHLVMKIEFCGDFEVLQPFPEIDLVDFFNGHPKLIKFEIHGAMFAALCQKNSLKNLDSRFCIPCLEELLITVRSPLNAEQKLCTLESLVKYSVKLQSMVIRISQMKNCHDAADDFFEEICKFKYINYRKVRIE
ncbi:F-box protein-like [Hordeum vulgare]|uniref:F-box domain-containing protein n=1 Tax=Hordeum vulgare subsp. vulgare TaxID=112509 RepID=A0A8I6Y2H7_HORVV|nr:F-box protein At1g10780 [Hordeum vulgare subsp. vulgare]KAE8821572.1 F-box protein-like [Hordeum vulgare]